MSKLGLRLHADEEHWIPLSDLMTGLMFLFLLISLAYMVAADLKHAKPTSILKNYVASRTQIYDHLNASLGPNLQRWHASIDPQTLSIRFSGNTGLFQPGTADLTPQFQAALKQFFPQYVSVLLQHRSAISEIRVEGFTSTRSSGEYLGDMDLSQARARNVLRYALSLQGVKPAFPWLTQLISADGFSYSRPVRAKNGKVDQAASDRVEFHVLSDANAKIAAALQVSPGIHGRLKATPTPVPAQTIDAPLPTFPDWARSLIGTRLSDAFPHIAVRCYGYADSVIAQYVGRPAGVQLAGWAYDMNAWEPVSRVLLVDAGGTIVGAADGGYPREDVQKGIKWVASPNTGWRGSVARTSVAVTPWAIMPAPRTVCRLNIAANIANEKI